MDEKHDQEQDEHCSMKQMKLDIKILLILIFIFWIFSANSLLFFVAYMHLKMDGVMAISKE